MVDRGYVAPPIELDWGEKEGVPCGWRTQRTVKRYLAMIIIRKDEPLREVFYYHAKTRRMYKLNSKGK